MLNLNNKNTAFLITIFGLIYILSFIVSTEVLTDNSVMSQSPTLAWGLLVAVIPSVVFILMGLKYSTIMSLISLGLIGGISFILFMYKNTLEFYAIEEDLAKKFINDKNLNDFEDITKISGDWIKDQMITVLFYGKKEFNYDISDEALLSVDKLNEVKDKFIKKVNKESSMREDSNKPLIVSEDFSSVDIKNKGDQKLFAKMLNSIYYTKFAKNLILVLKVDNHKNLTSSGFDRSIIEKSVVTSSESKDSDKANPPADEDDSKNTKSNSEEDDDSKNTKSNSEEDDDSKNTKSDKEGGNKSKDANADKENNSKDTNEDKEINPKDTNADKEINPKDTNADKEINPKDANSDKDTNADKERIQSKTAELNKDVESESRNTENLSKNQEDNGSPVSEQSKEKSDDNAEVLDNANGPQQSRGVPIVIAEYTQRGPESTTNDNQQSQGAPTEVVKDDQISENAADDSQQNQKVSTEVGGSEEVHNDTVIKGKDNTNMDNTSGQSESLENIADSLDENNSKKQENGDNILNNFNTDSSITNDNKAVVKNNPILPSSGKESSSNKNTTTTENNSKNKNINFFKNKNKNTTIENKSKNKNKNNTIENKSKNKNKSKIATTLKNFFKNINFFKNKNKNKGNRK